MLSYKEIIDNVEIGSVVRLKDEIGIVTNIRELEIDGTKIVSEFEYYVIMAFDKRFKYYESCNKELFNSIILNFLREFIDKIILCIPLKSNNTRLNLITRIEEIYPFNVKDKITSLIVKSRLVEEK